MKKFKPMFACSTIPNLSEINYPVIAMPKYDGIRCIIKDNNLLSRTLKPIPSIAINNWLKSTGLNNLDGELMAYNKVKNSFADFNVIQSLIMSSYTPQPILRNFNFVYHVFDTIHDRILTDTYKNRLSHVNAYLKNFVNSDTSWTVSISPHVVINNLNELLNYHKKLVSKGYEGTIIRSITKPYKFGRSTLREGGMLKVKNFTDNEAEVIRFNELLINNNEQITDNLGNLIRSNHNANKIPGDKLGSITCELDNGVQFDLGSGFNEVQRIAIWKNPIDYLGKVTFKHQGFCSDGKPRFPIFKGFRYD